MSALCDVVDRDDIGTITRPGPDHVALLASATNAPSDAQLLHAIQQRDLTAFDTFCERHQRTALALAVRQGCDPVAGERVVLDAFLTIWRNAGRFDPTHFTPLAWLLGVVSFHCRRQSGADNNHS